MENNNNSSGNSKNTLYVALFLIVGVIVGYFLGSSGIKGGNQTGRALDGGVVATNEVSPREGGVTSADSPDPSREGDGIVINNEPVSQGVIKQIRLSPEQEKILKETFSLVMPALIDDLNLENLGSNDWTIWLCYGGDNIWGIFAGSSTGNPIWNDGNGGYCMDLFFFL